MQIIFSPEMILTRRNAIAYSLSGIAATLVSSMIDEPQAATVPDLRSIYVPGWRLVTKKGVDRYLDMISGTEINALMVDTKDAHGYLYIPSKDKLVKKINAFYRTADRKKRPLKLEYLADSASKKGVKLIARHVMFRDRILYDKVKSFRAYAKSKNEKWVDLLNEDVVSYNLTLLSETAKLNFDHIVLDYIRFPAIKSHYKISLEKKCNIIDNVVGKAKKNVNCDLGVQVFGYTALHYKKAGVGQRIPTLQENADYIYPMVYPSHFWPGTFGFKVPADHPYDIIDRSYKHAKSKITTRTKIIPMIQAFNYGSEKIMEQLEAVKDNSIPGYSCWNPGGNYTNLFSGLNGKTSMFDRINLKLKERIRATFNLDRAYTQKLPKPIFS